MVSRTGFIPGFWAGWFASRHSFACLAVTPNVTEGHPKLLPRPSVTGGRHNEEMSDECVRSCVDKDSSPQTTAR